MKVLFVPAKKKIRDFKIPENLPKELFIAYSLQYEDLAKKIRKILEQRNHKIAGFKQVLGCTKLHAKSPILLIGSGRFHALNLALQNNVPIYMYNEGMLEEIGKIEMENLKKAKEAAKRKFILAENIGIIVSTKPGQENMEGARILKEKIAKRFPEKQVFIFISNTINTAELENFQINFWINTACPRITEDCQKIFNPDDIAGLF